ncbi:MAG: hypothetical protein RL026_675 [Pseudomonadota bacterium]
MFAVIFRAQVRALDDDYFRTAQHLRELARRDCGCLGFQAVTEGDLETAISYWPDPASIAAWRDHPEHARARQVGRERWYASFSTEVIELPDASRCTSRLMLGVPTAADAPFLFELMTEPGYLQHIGDRGIHAVADAAAYLQAGPVAHFARHGFGLFRVALREGDVPIGLCGLIQRDYLPDVDLGFAFLPAWRGQGLAYEAATAVLHHAREDLGLRRLAAIVSPANTPSRRLLERLGFAHEGDLALPGEDKRVEVYGLSLSSAVRQRSR